MKTFVSAWPALTQCADGWRARRYGAGPGLAPVLHALVSEVLEVHVAAQRMTHRNLLAHASSAPGIW